MNDNKYQAKLQPNKVIKCPHCGWEYLASEVLYPDNVIGKVDPRTIVRDPLGHILYFENQEDCEALAEEHFICDHCETPFVVEVETKFVVKAEEDELNFKDQVVSLW